MSYFTALISRRKINIIWALKPEKSIQRLIEKLWLRIQRIKSPP